MYNNSYINWKDILIKIILLILFIVLLVWIIPNPKLDTFYDNVFTNNIETMKNAAKSYYTVDRLPESIGDSTSMTLKDMINSHMLIEFTDKEGNTCNTEESYVSVTKTGEKEYVLKVQLNCGDQSDYILETIGCYDLCVDGNCKQEVPEVEEEIIEYQFKKEIPSSVTTYSCPSGYTKKGTNCYKTTTGTTINASAIYSSDSTRTESVVKNAKKNSTGSYLVYANAIVKNGNLVCPDGYKAENNRCVKTYNASSSTKGTTYTCPEGYVLNGANCYKTYNATWNAGSSSYSCPSGYTLSGTNCIKTNTSTVDATWVAGGTSYSCPSGYTLSGSKCTKSNTVTIDATANTSGGHYTCPSGYSLSGSSCTKTVTDTVAGTVTKVYGSWSVVSTSATTSARSTYQNETERLVSKGTEFRYTCGTPSKCPVKSLYYIYSLERRSVTNKTTCPSGYSPSGSNCVKSYTDTKSATWVAGGTTYSCPSGYNLSGTKCTKTTTETINATPSNGQGHYTCPSGYNLSGSKCTKTTTDTIAATKNSKNGSYTCPNGGVLNGAVCITSKAASTTPGSTSFTCPYGGVLNGAKCYNYADGTVSVSYSCPDGYTASGSGENLKCSKEVKGTDTLYCEDSNATLKDGKCYTSTVVNIKGDLQGYTCPAGYTKNGTKCTTTVTKTIKATAKTTKSTSNKYTWSTEKTLNGWTATGKTRTVNKDIK